jgi:outer membrane protein
MTTQNVLLGAAAASLLAALSPLASGAAQAKGFIATVGVRATTRPPYEGADHNITQPAPILSLRPADRPYRFTPPDGGATVALLDTDHFSLGPILRVRYKRDATGSLRGLDPVKWAAEPGVFAEVWPTKWLRGRAELRRGVGGHKGLVADVGGDLVYTGARWDFSVGPRLGWGDNKYLDTYFGVTPLEAARSPLIAAAYDPTSGRRYTGVEFAGAYHLDKKWKVTFDAGYRSLADKASDSPIIRIAGDTSQLLGSVGLSYSFGLGL